MARSKVRGFLCGMAALVVVCATPAAAAAAPGQVDAAFGILNNGTVTADHGRHDFVVKVLRQADGKILTIATGSDANLNATMVVSRYLANGQIDFAFGQSGSLTTPIQGTGFVSDAALQPDGKIVIVGWTDPPADFFITRLRPNGTRDPRSHLAHPTTNFGPATRSTRRSPLRSVRAARSSSRVAPVPTPRSRATPRRVRSTPRSPVTDSSRTTSAADPKRTTLRCIAGRQASSSQGARAPASGLPRVVLAQFNANGTLDATFGTAGRVNPASTPIGSAAASARAGNQVGDHGQHHPGDRRDRALQRERHDRRDLRIRRNHQDAGREVPRSSAT